MARVSKFNIADRIPPTSSTGATAAAIGAALTYCVDRIRGYLIEHRKAQENTRLYDLLSHKSDLDLASRGTRRDQISLFIKQRFD